MLEEISQFSLCCPANKGFWSELLGISDFYYELGIQIIESCLRTRNENGGLIELAVLQAHVAKMRGRQRQKVSKDDICRSIEKLDALGGGVKVLRLGNKLMVQSVPTEMNVDQQQLLATAAKHNGVVTKSLLQRTHHWNSSRTDIILQPLLQEGMAWVDDKGEEQSYWYVWLVVERFLSFCSSSNYFIILSRILSLVD